MIKKKSSRDEGKPIRAKTHLGNRIRLAKRNPIRSRKPTRVKESENRIRLGTGNNAIIKKPDCGLNRKPSARGIRSPFPRQCGGSPIGDGPTTHHAGRSTAHYIGQYIIFYNDFPIMGGTF